MISGNDTLRIMTEERCRNTPSADLSEAAARVINEMNGTSARTSGEEDVEPTQLFIIRLDVVMHPESVTTINAASEA